MGKKIILFLSDYKEDKKEKQYYYTENDFVMGSQTNDAPTKYFLLNYDIDEILCIVSDKVKNTTITLNDVDKNSLEISGESTAYKRYCEMIKSYCQDSEKNLTKIVPIDYLPKEQEDQKKVLAQMCSEIFKMVKKKDKIYIDFTGGMRDINFLIVLIIRYFEYAGIECKQVIYSHIEGKIIDITYMYNGFHLITGTNEFTSFGDSSSLSKYLNNNNISDDANSKAIKKLLNAMKIFSESMSLCLLEVNKIDEILEEMNIAISEFEKCSKENASFEQIMFSFLMDEVKEKFHCQKDQQSTITILNLIQWCLDNNMIQQAVTLYIEKLPNYCIQQGWFESDVLEGDPTKAVAEKFYTNCFKKITYETSTLKEILKDEDNARKIKGIGEENLNNKNLNENFILDLCKNYPVNAYIRTALNNICLYLYYRCKKNDIENALAILPDNICSISSSRIQECYKEMHNNNKYLQYLLYRFDIVVDNEKLQKIQKLKRLESSISDTTVVYSWSNVSKSDLLILLRDYLFFKIIRNQINHANRTEQDNDTKEYFKDYNVDLQLSSSEAYQKLRKIMQEALNSVIKIKKCH